MQHGPRLQFSLRTLLVMMLILGASPWIYLKWRKYREDHIWNSIETAKADRDKALIAWRTAYDVYASEKSDASAAAEIQAQKSYYAARQKVAGAVKQLNSLYEKSPGGLERAIAIRRGKEALARQAATSTSRPSR
jgi:hypothetical protein